MPTAQGNTMVRLKAAPLESMERTMPEQMHTAHCTLHTATLQPMENPHTGTKLTLGKNGDEGKVVF